MTPTPPTVIHGRPDQHAGTYLERLGVLADRIHDAFANAGRAQRSYGVDSREYNHAAGLRRGLIKAYAIITGEDVDDVGERFHDAYQSSREP